ncbi:hypothetical protein [Priestia aryabhattai]|uniref:hypothetical protein n=1 Tax=Priestia aryabhattai TaxID=412384 RepID=UPI0030EBF549
MSFKAEVIQKIKEIHGEELNYKLAEEKARGKAESYINQYFHEFQTELHHFITNGIISVDTNRYGKNSEFLKLVIGSKSLAFEQDTNEKVIKVTVDEVYFDEMKFNGNYMESFKFNEELSDELLDTYIKESFGEVLEL